MGQNVCALLILRDSRKLPSQVVIPPALCDCSFSHDSANTVYLQTFNLLLFLSLPN